jgi:hypothetical protein
MEALARRGITFAPSRIIANLYQKMGIFHQPMTDSKKLIDRICLPVVRQRLTRVWINFLALIQQEVGSASSNGKTFRLGAGY